jgi:hypothetical protein
MGVSDLKANIHLMVDEIENESILQTLFEFLSGRKNNGQSSFWQGLSDAQRQEILLAFDESEKEENLIDKETFLSSL